MSRDELMRAYEASQARLMALMDDLAALHARMPDKGVDPLPEELVLMGVINAEIEESKRITALQRADRRRRRWLEVAGGILAGVALCAAIAFAIAY